MDEGTTEHGHVRRQVVSVPTWWLRQLWERRTDESGTRRQIVRAEETERRAA